MSEQLEQIVQVAGYIDKTIESFGIESPKLEHLDLSNTDVCGVIQAFYRVLLKNRNSQDQQEETQHLLSRAQDDVNSLRQKQGWLKEEVAKKDRDAATAEETHRQMLLKDKKQSEQLRKSREEVKKLQVEKQQLATHFTHWKKRQELDHTKLKEKLQKLLNDKNNERKFGMKALSLLQRKDGSRGQWAKQSKADEDLQSIIVVNYENRLKDATLENKELRESLKQMEAELTNVFNTIEESASTTQATMPTLQPGDQLTNPMAPSPLKPGHFELPFSESRSGIQQSLKQTMTNLRTRISELYRSRTPGTSNEQEIVELQSKLEECGNIIERQRAALFEESEPSPSKSFLSDSIVHEKAGNLQHERTEFEQERSNFEHEREMFLEAATKLDFDRARVLAANMKLPPTPKVGATPRRYNAPHSNLKSNLIATPHAMSSLIPTSMLLTSSTPAVETKRSTNLDLAKYLQMESPS